MARSGSFVDFVVDFGKSSDTSVHLSSFLIQRMVKHFPELLLGHVRVGVHHLESANVNIEKYERKYIEEI